MKPLEIDITARALNQLDDIQISLEEMRSGRADKFVERLRKTGELLLLFPEIGVAKSHLGDGMRAFLIWDYVLLYRVTTAHVRVEAIIHGARNIESAFYEE